MKKKSGIVNEKSELKQRKINIALIEQKNKKNRKYQNVTKKKYKIAMALAGHHRLAKNKLCKNVKRFEPPDSRLISLVNSLKLFLAGNVDLEIF